MNARHRSGAESSRAGDDIHARTPSDDEFLSRRAGLSVLTGIVVVVAVCLASFGSRGARPRGATLLMPIEESASAVDFRSDVFFLEDDPLLGFVEIPAGSFVMGSDPRLDNLAFENERWSSERFQGRVDLPDYYLGRHEVTVAQFRAFVDATGYAADRQASSGRANDPVTFVSWTDAWAYARWLEQALLGSPQTPVELSRLLNEGWHLGLPDEAQWEKAARGNDGRTYPWGSSPDRTFANFDSTAVVTVGSYECAECAFAVDDLSGNVWELTRSVYQPYPFDPSDDWEDLGGDALFVMRGGSFQDGANTVRAAVRGGVDPGARRAFIGFRLALAPE